MTASIFTCNSDVRIDLPFPEDNRLWALWASHDCSDFDLILTVVLNKATQDDFLGFVGADLSKKGCVDVYWFENTIACEFVLNSRGENFGILFEGGFTPVFYTTEWVRASAWIPAYSWW